jgi:hypothetical protein
MGNFATGVTILTTALGEELHGMTANAVCSVSLDPLLVLVCVNKQARTHAVLSESGVFAVNVLAEEQEHLSRLFADDAVDAAHSLTGLSYRRGVTGAPILTDCLAYVECRVVAAYPGGDHTSSWEPWKMPASCGRANLSSSSGVPTASTGKAAASTTRRVIPRQEDLADDGFYLGWLASTGPEASLHIIRSVLLSWLFSLPLAAKGRPLSLHTDGYATREALSVAVPNWVHL